MFWLYCAFNLNMKQATYIYINIGAFTMESQGMEANVHTVHTVQTVLDMTCM